MLSSADCSLDVQVLEDAAQFVGLSSTMASSSTHMLELVSERLQPVAQQFNLPWMTGEKNRTHETPDSMSFRFNNGGQLIIPTGISQASASQRSMPTGPRREIRAPSTKQGRQSYASSRTNTVADTKIKQEPGFTQYRSENPAPVSNIPEYNYTSMHLYHSRPRYEDKQTSGGVVPAGCLQGRELSAAIGDLINDAAPPIMRPELGPAPAKSTSLDKVNTTLKRKSPPMDHSSLPIRSGTDALRAAFMRTDKRMKVASTGNPDYGRLTPPHGETSDQLEDGEVDEQRAKEAEKAIDEGIAQMIAEGRGK
ncbi:hypothetical protein BDV96DRAFT_84525 [Lophiotrema nucula]|uniref:Uncharacterized protein n=1 Tax=Lophiotrema nucula TaxID=690887 RepID=A0A6A5Z6I0_9PLEO|nr:hypothetical protein BDV96DRAFT_84525 [Lophiotrema nucula]